METNVYQLVNKEVVMYIYNGIHIIQLLKTKQKKEILPFGAAWTDIESIMLSEGSQKEKDK